jgi:hypothetical protein
VTSADDRRSYREPDPDKPTIDLGHDVRVHFTTWHEHDPVGLIVYHPSARDGKPCVGSILFDLEGVAAAFPNSARWTVHSLDPLHVEPSLLCSCGHHGWIRAGRWEPC